MWVWLLLLEAVVQGDSLLDSRLIENTKKAQASILTPIKGFFNVDVPRLTGSVQNRFTNIKRDIVDQTWQGFIKSIKSSVENPPPKFKAKSDKAESAKSESAKSDLAKSARLDLAKSDPTNSDPLQSNPAKSEPAKSDPQKSDPVDSGTAELDVTKSVDPQTSKNDAQKNIESKTEGTFWGGWLPKIDVPSATDAHAKGHEPVPENASSKVGAMMGSKAEREDKTVPSLSTLRGLNCVPQISLNSCFQHCFDTIVADKNEVKAGVLGISPWEYTELHKCLISVCVGNYVLSPIPGCLGPDGTLSSSPPAGDIKSLDFHDPTKLEIWKDWRMFGLRKAWHNLNETSLILKTLTVISLTFAAAGIPIFIIYLLIPAMSCMIDGSNHLPQCASPIRIPNCSTQPLSCSRGGLDCSGGVAQLDIPMQIASEIIEGLSRAAQLVISGLSKAFQDGSSLADVTYKPIPTKQDIPLSDEIRSKRFDRQPIS